MSYYPKGHRHSDNVPEFDEYDHTPYGGGYDISLTYGRPTPPSEETCYPPTSSSDDFDYDRPHYTSSAEPSAYADEALDNEYQSYSKPKSRPSCSHKSKDGAEDEKPRHKPGMNRPSGGYGGESEYGESGIESDETGYGSRSVRETEKGTWIWAESDEYGSGYGRKSEYEEKTSAYNCSYGRKTDSDEHGSGYREEKSSEYGSGYGQKADSGEYRSKPASGYGSRNIRESDEYMSSYGRKTDSDEYGSSGYGKKAKLRRGIGQWGDDDYDEDEEKKQRHKHRHHCKHSDE
ncbi:hypothetical protein K7X08_033647 [Anisodus acutangulus]|uniref:Uncharacterized protein n=1 Tax=Anisodus acutangulus TaxID=402998 RepID=A0A9Q1M311_9SOLA|nr:hypothetical protein K7X08_033647 [Anisodus acutangulus]